ncbi:MAG: CAP domain-containing protein [Myxococcota bacterium]|nr:CAP domain-containing protein [Myxococcota bacterium]
MSSRALVFASSIVWLVLGACVADAPSDPAALCPARDAIECATDVGGVVPQTITGDTTGADDGYQGSGCGSGGGAAIEDAAFRFTAPRTARYRFSTEGSAFDTILSVRAGSCGGRETTCNDDGATGSTHSVVTMDLTSCTTVTIVVDGYDTDGVGAFTLSITASEASCSDGVDDDGDGLVDCEDPDCQGPRCDIQQNEWPDEWIVLEAGVLEATNRVRAEGAVCDGVEQPPAPALERDELLEVSARLHSLDMIEQDYFEHESLDGRTPFDRMAAAGFMGPGPLGENIASGYSTVDEVMAGWMSSPGHCVNIMNPSYRVMGVGYAEGGSGTRWTQNFGGGH